MLFMACLMGYMMRVNMSINIIAMVEPKESDDEVPDVSLNSFVFSQSDETVSYSMDHAMIGVSTIKVSS